MEEARVEENEYVSEEDSYFIQEENDDFDDIEFDDLDVVGIRHMKYLTIPLCKKRMMEAK